MGSVHSNTVGTVSVVERDGRQAVFLQHVYLPESNFIVGVANVAEYVQFSVYPNPASEKLTVQVTLKQNEKATMEIVNTLGEVVASLVSDLSAGQSSVDFNVKDLASGSYFISVSTAEGKVVKPFMVD